MNDSDHIDAALANLQSEDIESKIRAVEYLAIQTQVLVDAVVEHLQDPEPARYLIFERLVRFGSLAVAPLQRILSESKDGDTRTLAAAALAFLGSRAGESNLLGAVRWGDPNLCVAVKALAEAQAPSAIPLIEEALRHGQIDEATSGTIECLLSGLKRLGAPVPEDILDRLRRAEPAWLGRGCARRYT